MKKSTLTFSILVLGAGALGSCTHTQRAEPTASPVTQADYSNIEMCRAPSALGGTYTCKSVFDPTNPAGREYMSVSEMQSAYERVQRNLFWRKWIDHDVDFLTFIRLSSMERAKAEGKHPSATYGFEQYRAWRQGEDFVNAVPIGELKLTPAFIAQAHKIITQALSPTLKKIDPMIPDGYLPDAGGVYKKRDNYGKDPLLNPIDEQTYQNLKNNKWLGGFVELPWPLSRKGKRRGWIKYADSRDNEQKLKTLLDWYEKNKGTMDPIELAAKFQYRFVSIHPLVDGNGRISTLIMNRILREHGLPPMARTNVDFDIYLTEDQWVNAVRAGVEDYINLAREMKPDEIPSIYNTNFKDGPRLSIYPESARSKKNKAEIAKVDAGFRKSLSFVSRKLFPAASDAEFTIGNQKFLFAMDGFFYNNRGIPHVLHDNKLYPVADRTYFLYAENGEVSKSQRRFSKRMISVPHRDVLRSHFHLIRNIESQAVNPGAIEIVPYTTIQEANDKGDIFLHDFQKSLFENAIHIRDEDPVAVLATGRGYMTVFEIAFAKGWSFSGADALAQYQLMDMKFFEFLQIARKAGNSEWEAEIERSRQKLFVAGKTLLARIDANFNALSTEEQTYYSQDPAWRFFNEYRKETALGFDTLDVARAKIGDGRYILIRSDNSAPRYIGFRSREAYHEMAKNIGGYETFRKWIISAGDEVKRGYVKESVSTRMLRQIVPAFETLIPKVANFLQTNRYDTRGTEDEFQRLYVDHYLHAVNSPLKNAVSFSTSTDLYIRTKVNEKSGKVEAHLPFTTEGMSGAVYFVRVNANEVDVNFASKYFRQYEVLGMTSISPFRVVRTFRDDFFRLPEMEVPQNSNFMETGFTLRPTGPATEEQEP